MRGINEIILALIFVAAVGLGPFAGVLALAMHGAGMLGKFFAEAIEDIDEGPLEALRARPAPDPSRPSSSACCRRCSRPGSASSSTASRPTSRQSTVLGMVGAGGIGFELVGRMKLFQYQDTATCILVILAMVLAADLISSRVRAMIRVIGLKGRRHDAAERCTIGKG